MDVENYKKWKNDVVAIKKRELNQSDISSEVFAKL